jgi:Tubulin-tyrosine ligase family
MNDQASSASVLACAKSPTVKIERSLSLSAAAKPTDPLITRFKYVVNPGNNSRVILQALRNRPWWSPVNRADAADSANLCWEMYKEKQSFAARAALPPGHRRAINHLENTSALVTKKGLYYSLKAHCQRTGIDLWSIIPKTWHLLPQQASEITAAASTDSAQPAAVDAERASWIAYHDALIAAAASAPAAAAAQAADTVAVAEPEAGPAVVDETVEAPLWIVKPAALANRGCGIRVLATQAAVLAMIDSSSSSSSSSSRRRSTSSSVVGAAASSSKKEQLLRSKPQRRHSTNSSTNSTSSNGSSSSSSSGSCSSSSAARHGYIVQQYITSPLLVSGRKFDVRCFVLLVAAPVRRRASSLQQQQQQQPQQQQQQPQPQQLQQQQQAVAPTSATGEPPVTDDVATDVCQSTGKSSSSSNSNSSSSSAVSSDTSTSSRGGSEMQAYVHCDAYARTSSTPFSAALRTLGDRRMHLTNDAVQKGGSSFGLHEAGNKLSMQELQVTRRTAVTVLLSITSVYTYHVRFALLLCCYGIR